VEGTLSRGGGDVKADLKKKGPRPLEKMQLRSARKHFHVYEKARTTIPNEKKGEKKKKGETAASQRGARRKPRKRLCPQEKILHARCDNKGHPTGLRKKGTSFRGKRKTTHQRKGKKKNDGEEPEGKGPLGEKGRLPSGSYGPGAELSWQTAKEAD